MLYFLKYYSYIYISLCKHFIDNLFLSNISKESETVYIISLFYYYIYYL